MEVGGVVVTVLRVASRCGQSLCEKAEEKECELGAVDPSSGGTYCFKEGEEAEAQSHTSCIQRPRIKLRSFIYLFE
jgi:hypothetical protein